MQKFKKSGILRVLMVVVILSFLFFSFSGCISGEDAGKVVRDTQEEAEDWIDDFQEGYGCASILIPLFLIMFVAYCKNMKA